MLYITYMKFNDCNVNHIKSTILPLKVLVKTTDTLGHFPGDTFKQDNYSTVGGDGGCRVDEVRVGTTCPTIRVLSYSNCQRSPTPFLSEASNFKSLILTKIKES